MKKANQALVRSIPKSFKQSLKDDLADFGFKGYKFAELTPNKTRYGSSSSSSSRTGMRRRRSVFASATGMQLPPPPPLLLLLLLLQQQQLTYFLITHPQEGSGS